MDDLPPPIKVTPDLPITSPSKSENSFKNALKFIVKIKWVKVAGYLTGAAMVIHLIINYPPFQNLVNHYFPNSSPVFARPVSLQGVLRSSTTGIYSLVLPNQEAYTLHFKPATSLANLKRLNEVVVKGNLTWESFIIENAEVYPLNFTTSDDADSPQTQISPISSITSNLPGNPNAQLPQLYSGLQWESSQKKILLFTSGKRRIEVEGFHLESSRQTAFPQDFINYYIQELKGKEFKETLNSIDPDGITVTYSSGDLFLTFGVKNIYTGRGDDKKLAAYKAFIEHN